MSRLSAIQRGREMQDESMIDTVKVEYRTGKTFNDTTGESTFTYAERFTSIAKLAVGSLGSLVPTSKDDLAGGRMATELRRVMYLPVTAPQVYPDDVITVTDVGEGSDSQLLGRRLRVVAPIGETWGTARRFSVEEQLT